MADLPAENKDFFVKALEHMDRAYESVKAGNLPEGVAYLVINLKELHVTLMKNHLGITQKHQEFIKDIESNHAAMLNLSAHNTTHASLLAKHDGLLDHNRGAQGITKNFGGILESRAVGGLTNVGRDNG